MAKDIVIVRDVLSPTEKKVLNFTFNHPSRLLSAIPNYVKDVMKVDSADFFEDKIAWDKSSEDVSFFAQWRAKRGEDKYTNFWVTIVLQGKQNSKTKDGSVTIVILPTIKTELPSETTLQYIVSRLYYNMFYRKQLEYYLNAAKRDVEEIENAIKRLVGFLKEEGG